MPRHLDTTDEGAQDYPARANGQNEGQVAEDQHLRLVENYRLVNDNQRSELDSLREELQCFSKAAGSVSHDDGEDVTADPTGITEPHLFRDVDPPRRVLVDAVAVKRAAEPPLLAWAGAQCLAGELRALRCLCSA